MIIEIYRSHPSRWYHGLEGTRCHVKFDSEEGKYILEGDPSKSIEFEDARIYPREDTNQESAPMIVEIIRSRPEYWYHDKEGKLYSVKPEPMEGKYVLSNDSIRRIRVEDARIVNDFDMKPAHLAIIAPGSRARIGEVEVLVTSAHIEANQVEYTVAWWTELEMRFSPDPGQWIIGALLAISIIGLWLASALIGRGRRDNGEHDR